ncbi:zinc finger CCCH domain-containing protein 3 isoform X2 [Choloepus didactylus]|uniref:zinc finger CCCH domain-containing protein 3 isoform X2 n=1 Tax=Choloepus didactylus TaxID=27675 RepID=UPI0018A04E00|nr:zinc finger CCCH domain-containing protein 3 isoform X2 [Choloepus didactylus]
MTSRGPVRATRSREMEEKEQLRRQIRLLQGLIDDYKNLHGNASALPCPSATARWQPPAFNNSRSFSARYPRSSRRGFSPHHGPAWRKKYSLVNRPPGPAGLPGDRATQAALGPRDSQGPDPRRYVLQQQVQLSPDQDMVIKIKPPSKPSSVTISGALRGSMEDLEDTPWGDHRPQEGEGDPPGQKLQPPRPGRAKESGSEGDPLLVCQKEPGQLRVAKSVSAMSGSPPEPWRTVSESAIAVKARSGAALGRKAGPHSAGSCAAQLSGGGRANTGHPEQPHLAGGPARLTSGPRQAREVSLLVSCRTNKFRKNNYKWVATSAKSPRAARRALSPRVAVEGVSRGPCGTAERTGKPQLRAEPDARPRKAAPVSKPGTSPSKYKWKASSLSASSSSSFRWQAEAGSKDRTSQLSVLVSRSPPEDKPAVGPSGSEAAFGEAPLSTYKVKSRTKIVRRRGSASLPGDKKTSPAPGTTVRSHPSLRRKQALRGKGSPILRKTPSRGPAQVTRHRLCRLPPARALLSAKEVPSLLPLRTPPASKVIKTRYRLVKKNLASPLSVPPCHLPLPSWRARRLTLSRSLVLNRLRPAASSGGKAPPGPPQWRSRGYRCIGGVLYRVSANKLSRTCSRHGDGGSRPVRSGRLDPASSGSRALASRAVQRSLAVVRQARQKKERRREEYCMYYNRFGRCSRGDCCPYIHDPEKVAVCTRFLRGTCKKTDGTCPFSHHVSKDKCKKKHTLLCPDFSRRGVCPRGTQCQLLHRSQRRPARRAATPPTPEPSDASPRSRASSGHGPRKASAAQRPARQTPSSVASGSAAPASPPRSPGGSASASPESSPAPSSPCPSSAASDREDLSLQEAAPPGPSCRGLSKLPSFISLQSPPSPRGQPRARARRSPPAQDAGKRLHIKPRL